MALINEQSPKVEVIKSFAIEKIAERIENDYIKPFNKVKTSVEATDLLTLKIKELCKANVIPKKPFEIIIKANENAVEAGGQVQVQLFARRLTGRFMENKESEKYFKEGKTEKALELVYCIIKELVDNILAMRMLEEENKGREIV